MKFFKKLIERIEKYDEAHHFTCDVCDREVFGNERICARCEKELPWNAGEICPFCGRKVKEAGVCLECKEKPLETERARSVFTHEGEAARLVLRLKRGQKYLVPTLAELLFPFCERNFRDADGFAFVPMTKKAERRRGYNQSRLLAEALACRTGKPLFDAAEKRRDTPPQKSLSRREREKNLEGCFHVTDRALIKDKTILIIDDTFTTGATSSALAAAFKRAGAKKAYLLTVTSVEKQNPFGKPPQQ